MNARRFARIFSLTCAYRPNPTGKCLESVREYIEGFVIKSFQQGVGQNFAFAMHQNMIYSPLIQVKALAFVAYGKGKKSIQNKCMPVL